MAVRRCGRNVKGDAQPATLPLEHAATIVGDEIDLSNWAGRTRNRIIRCWRGLLTSELDASREYRDQPDLLTYKDEWHIMAKAETQSTRLPRGTKPVAKAFLDALDSVSAAQQAAVARAAQILIRDELKARRDKVNATAAGTKARRPAKRAS